MKKLVKNYVGKARGLPIKETKSYLIEIDTRSIAATLKLPMKPMIRRREGIKKGQLLR